MLKPELEERSFGSSYDPLLNGVARGLERLFPPFDPVRAERSGPEASRSRPHPAASADPTSRQG